MKWGDAACGVVVGLLLALLGSIAVESIVAPGPVRIECTGDTSLVDNTGEVQRAVREAQGDCPFAARVKLPTCEIVTVNP